MRYSQYKFKFYLNASHAIYINGSMGERHPHTWEITINVLKEKDEFIQFSNLEKKIENWLKRYQDKFLNERAPFDRINPTMENCCDYFKEVLKPILQSEGWILLTIEMSETPTRSYVVNLFDTEDKIVWENNSDTIAGDILNDILKNKDRT
jgi:6-pyruvoyltetrahydropterin/6-carboxytetrahydropterin synthase